MIRKTAAIPPGPKQKIDQFLREKKRMSASNARAEF